MTARSLLAAVILAAMAAPAPAQISNNPKVLAPFKAVVERATGPGAGVGAGGRWLGLELDAGRNAHGLGCISSPGSRLSAWVVPTDEERMIARYTHAVVSA